MDSYKRVTGEDKYRNVDQNDLMPGARLLGNVGVQIPSVAASGRSTS